MSLRPVLFLVGTLCLPALARAQPLPVASSTLPDGVPIVNPLAGVAVTDMTSFLGRPLFSASRRPALPPANTAPPSSATSTSAAPATADHLRLVGTLASDSGALAVIEDTQQSTTVSVAEGGLLDGWRIVEIRPSLVRLERGLQVVVLAMFVPGKPAPIAAAPLQTPLATNGPSRQPMFIEGPTPSPIYTSGESIGPSTAGTLPGTAAAAAAAQSPFRLSFGDPPPPADR